MSYELEVRAFFFNAKTDYLPYYKNFNIVADSKITAKKLLSQIAEIDDSFSYPKQKLIFKIDGLVVDAKEPISNIVKKFGKSFQIDPVNSYRANNGLRFNHNDFMQSYELLEPYTIDSDLVYYKSLYALHYASETEKFDRDYIGDSILLLAYKMIKRKSKYTNEILDAISLVKSGLLDCEYENNLFNNEEHTIAIESLKNMVREPEKPPFIKRFKAFFNEDKRENLHIVERFGEAIKIDDLEDKSVAYYSGKFDKNRDYIDKLILNSARQLINFSRSNRLSGASILFDNQLLAFKKAGATLLDAFDCGAEVLVVEDILSFNLFKKYFSNIESYSGRKINLEIMTVDDFTTQVKSF